jgi:hypothetical protein
MCAELRVGVAQMEKATDRRLRWILELCSGAEGPGGAEVDGGVQKYARMRHLTAVCYAEVSSLEH